VQRNNSDAKNSDVIYKAAYPRTTMPSLKRSHTMGKKIIKLFKNVILIKKKLTSS
jgi:hypothetical protein